MALIVLTLGTQPASSTRRVRRKCVYCAFSHPRGACLQVAISIRRPFYFGILKQSGGSSPPLSSLPPLPRFFSILHPRDAVSQRTWPAPAHSQSFHFCRHGFFCIVYINRWGSCDKSIWERFFFFFSSSTLSHAIVYPIDQRSTVSVA